METTTKVQLTVSGLIADKNNGLKNDDMAKKYNLSPNQMRAALKAAGVNMRAKSAPKFEIINDITG